MTQALRVAITQPYVPEYRVPLFERVIAKLAEDRVEARVFFGLTKAQEKWLDARGNGRVPEWATRVPIKILGHPTGRRLQYRSLPADWSGPDLLLTEMQTTNLNAWEAAARRHPYVTLGHGRSYTGHEARWAAAPETYLNSRAAHVLTYMPSGSKAVMERTGRDSSSVTTFFNTVDTDRLATALAEVDAADTMRFRSQFKIPSDAKVALFLGVLAPYKRIDLLVDAAKDVFARDPRAWLIVAGDGPERHRLESLQRATGRVAILGHADPESFAVAAKLSHVLVNPGRVGLVAVDALTMGLPVITTPGSMDAPEVEYLEEGVNLFTVAATGHAISKAWTGSPGHVLSPEGGEKPSIERSAAIISDCLLGLLDSPGRRDRDT